MSFEKTLASGFPPSGESTVQGGGSHGSARRKLPMHPPLSMQILQSPTGPLHTSRETQTLEARGVSVLLTLLTGVLVPCTGVQPWTGLCCSFPATGSLT